MKRVNKLSPEKWIALATMKKQPGNDFEKPYGGIASDNYRIHADDNIPVIPDAASDRMITMLKENKKCKLTASFEKAALLTAALQVIAIGKAAQKRDDIIPRMLLVLEEDKLKFSAEANDNKTEGEFNCEYCGDALSILINPKYIVDALSGMEETTITLGTNGKNRPVYLTDNHGKHAVVMPCHLK